MTWKHVLVLAWLATPALAGSLPAYDVQIIPPQLPGYPANPTFVESRSISDNGALVGTHTYNSTFDVPFTYSAGVLSIVSTPSPYARAAAVNNNNVLVGWDPVNNLPQAFRNAGGSAEYLAGLGTQSQAWGINDAGVIVGWSSGNPAPGPSAMRGFVWESGTVTLLPTFGGTTSQAFAVNSLGHVTGSADVAGGQKHVFLWHDGVMEDLGGFSAVGATGGVGHDISDSGVIVGVMFTAAGQRAFRWHNGVVQNLGLLPGAASAQAWAINEAGDIVGDYSAGGQTRAFLWRDGNLYDLTAVIASSTLFIERIERAYDINESGEITGIAIAPFERTFIAAPVQSSVEYTVTVLPDPPGNVYTVVPEGLNNRGEAVGWANVTFGTPNHQAWKWTPAAGTVMLPPTGLGNYGCHDINDAGQIGGDSSVVTAEDAWRFENGSYTIIPLPPQNTWAVVTGMNSAGDLAGHSAGYSLNDPAHRFLYSDDTGLVVIPLPFNNPRRINDLQQVVGGNGDAQLWSIRDGLMNLGDPPGFSCTYATALNNVGLIAGRAHAYCGASVPIERIAWIYAGGALQVIVNISPPGNGNNNNEIPLAVNHSGTVVGYSDVPLEGDTPWVWSADQGVRLLNDVIDRSGLPSWFRLYQAVDVNESGQILAKGISLVPGNLNAAYLLTPVAPKTPSNPGDLNGDGIVNVDDLLMLLAAWGPCPPAPVGCPADIAPQGPPIGDGAVNVDDLLVLLANWS